ncbi:MAG: indole-3-glycerol phosphate synthase TrpC [Melioribacteraceae bacterium]|nr:indole-3-glycerol phosphate synthase TrpC [Melioribacteraceae bacterium]MCF8354200.1 indole-3-glycerol phosphate synthase TrpC [Melioribacteraceae bacterium]MCF8392846.1 indole-3-glycerol phosphate synthase TrpC [Melioribacteraceae bacterium]MCF8418668.1 indole-3-glycerol phosphate synthase TrpC [Melioribacteraceae bacterium]
MKILDEIIEVKKEEVKILRSKYTLSSFSDSEYFSKPGLSISAKIRSEENISIIAEIKKASPSKGTIRDNFNHMQVADAYINAGVSAISVLTDVNFFQGSIKFLNDIAGIKQIPLLRKDFIIDEYQVLEAKSNGADFVLLICEVLSKMQINDLTHAAIENDLEVLLELHSDNQLEKIDFTLNKLIGVNNRNLKDFSVDLKTTKLIKDNLPSDILVVSESGIGNESDIKFLKTSDIDAVLVGEHFMRSENIENSVNEMKRWCYNES